VARTTSQIPAGDGDAASFWVITTSVGKVWLLGNPHTFPGRMHVRALNGDLLSISLSDISSFGPGAAEWVDGYLAGAEPEVSITWAARADARRLEEGLARVRANFRRTGVWLGPTHVPPQLDDSVADAWIYWAGSTLKWTGAAWRLDHRAADLQGTFKAGSTCAARGYHQVSATPGWTLCEDCRWVD